MDFWVAGQKGIRIVDALNENFNGLHEAGARLLDSLGNKVSVRLAVSPITTKHVSGLNNILSCSNVKITGYAPYVKPKYVRRSTQHHESISRKQLASKVAEVVQMFVTAST